MTPCGRGCCWSPYACSRNRECACHWGEQRPAVQDGNTAARHRDPTANQAIANVMRGRNPKRRAKYKE